MGLARLGRLDTDDRPRVALMLQIKRQEVGLLHVVASAGHERVEGGGGLARRAAGLGRRAGLAVAKVVADPARESSVLACSVSGSRSDRRTFSARGLREIDDGAADAELGQRDVDLCKPMSSGSWTGRSCSGPSPKQQSSF